ncbi:MAG: DNA translocase FtsK [Pseudomonadota bacterium]
MTDISLYDDRSIYERARDALRVRIGQFLGLLLFAVSVASVVSLATWSVDDPSFSYATDRVPENALGFPGAALSDFAMQFVGLGVFALLLPALAASGRLITRRRGWASPLPKTAALLIALVFGCAALSALPPPGAWPLPLGLGGLVGDGALLIAERLAAPIVGGFATVLVAILFASISVPALALATGLSFKRRKTAVEDDGPPLIENDYVDERLDDLDYDADIDPEVDVDGDIYEEDDNPRAPLLGAVLHNALSLRAAIGRRLKRRRKTDDPDALSVQRLEPGFDAPVATDEVPFDSEMDDEPFYDEDVIDAEFEAYSEEDAPKKRVAPRAAPPKKGTRIKREAQRSLLPDDGFSLPPLHLLEEPKKMARDATLSDDALEQNARLLEGVLEDFGVRGEIVQVNPGPVVTLYELEPAPGTKSSRVIGLADDIARSMSAIAARVAVIPGRNAIGIELPNASRETVYLREQLASRDYEKSKSNIALALGKTIGGEPVIADLARMPHLLIAGTTGSGKSVAINTMILSILYRMTPENCRMIMIDPKMLELSVYDGIPHLLSPVVTDPKKAVVALKWVVREMEERYKNMSKVGVRNISGFNTRVKQALEKGETVSRTVQTGFNRDTGEALYETEHLDLQPMPFIVVVIDEMADLMMVAGKEIEGAVQRLAQMARAAGIHVIMATQRPSVDVITGTIKANFPTRISFQVTSKIDSRTILGEQGAEQLLGQGDMLYMAGGGRIKRVHGPFVSDEEVEDVVAFLKEQGVPEYLDEVTAEEEGGGGDEGLPALSSSNDLYDQAVAVVLRDKKASTSYIQRRLSIGYNRAASLIERMENEGVVGPANHAGKREILVGSEGDVDID